MSLIERLRRMFGFGPNGETAGITCHEALEVINEFLDGELDERPMADVQAHFEVCRRCYPQLRLEEAFREAMRRAAQGEKAPPHLRSRVKELLSRADA